MTYKDAKQIAEKLLEIEFKNKNYDVIIDVEYSFEFSRGWFFRYNTAEFINQGDETKSLFVTMPIIVDKIDYSVSRIRKKIDLINTAEKQVEEYISRKELDDGAWCGNPDDV